MFIAKEHVLSDLLMSLTAETVSALMTANSLTTQTMNIEYLYIEEHLHQLLPVSCGCTYRGHVSLWARCKEVESVSVK